MNHGIDTLTPRELQVMEAAARGKSAKETAQDLGISDETVKDHKHMAKMRLRARNTAHAVAMLVAAGVVGVV